jgi:hypothetical protein
MIFHQNASCFLVRISFLYIAFSCMYCFREAAIRESSQGTNLLSDLPIWERARQEGNQQTNKHFLTV